MHTNIENHVEETILKSRKSLLFDKNEIWIKKGQTRNFDVTMRSYDVAEVCELVGLFLLKELVICWERTLVFIATINWLLSKMLPVLK